MTIDQIKEILEGLSTADVRVSVNGPEWMQPEAPDYPWKVVVRSECMVEDRTPFASGSYSPRDLRMGLKTIPTEVAYRFTTGAADLLNIHAMRQAVKTAKASVQRHVDAGFYA